MQTATTADFLAELREQEKEREKEKTKKMVYKYGIIATIIGAKVFFFSKKDK